MSAAVTLCNPQSRAVNGLETSSERAAGSLAPRSPLCHFFKGLLLLLLLLS